MDDNSYTEMFEFIKRIIQKNPDNENYQRMLELLIQKKSEYDLERMRMQKEMVINQQNNYFKFCMQDAFFKHQWNLLTSGFTNVSFPIQQEGIKFMQ
jgi:hypothetical protein